MVGLEGLSWPFGKKLARQVFPNAASDGKFDLIFMDPPYYKDMAKNSLIKIAACDIITPNAYVILEHFKKDAIPNDAVGLKYLRQYKYGDTVLSFFRDYNDKKSDLSGDI